MNNEEIQSLMGQLKASGLTDEEIMATYYEAFEKGEMDRKDLETLAEAMGYELTDDFKNDSQPDPIASKEIEGASKEDLESAKEIAPGETKEEFKDKIDETAKVGPGEGEGKPVEGEPAKDEAKPSEEEPKTESEDDKKSEEKVEGEEDDEKGWEEAQKMFKI